MRFDDTARSILKKRYYAPGESSPEDLLDRVSSFLARGDKPLGRIYFDLMAKGLFLPNSPCLANAGRENGGLFACFVLGMEDSLDSITQAKSDAMQITKFGGGWGIPLGNLRPAGTIVRGSTHGVAGGPIGFWETFSHDMKVMTQGGFRDAACMATMQATHPDIMKFLKSKSSVNSVARMLQLDKLLGDKAIEEASRLLNLDPLMRSASEQHLSNFNISVLMPSWIMNADGEDKLIELSFAGEVYATMAKRELLGAITDGMWRNGEPGLLFIDTIRGRTRYEPESINATNPCGEQALPPNGSCCLGSINLSAHVEDRELNTAAMKATIWSSVQFLNSMVELNKFPTYGTMEWSARNRSIGLGVMGWADALVKMGVPYDSHAAVSLASSVASFIMREVEECSRKYESESLIRKWDGRANRALMSIAPTGTISMLAGCSPGIEPPFRPLIHRVDNTGEHVIEHELANNKNFRSIKDIDQKWLIRHVAAWAGHVDNSISYTVNVEHDATVGQIRDLVEYAHAMNCNGITIYRDRSRNAQVLNEAVDSGMARESNGVTRIGSGDRPGVLAGNTYKFSAMVGGDKSSVYVTINKHDGRAWELFVTTPHIHSAVELQLSTAVTRLTSRLLRVGDDPEKIIEQLRKIEGQSLLSIPAVIANTLEIEEGMEIKCGECGGEMVRSGGCITCASCGYSSCG